MVILVGGRMSTKSSEQSSLKQLTCPERTVTSFDRNTFKRRTMKTKKLRQQIKTLQKEFDRRIDEDNEEYKFKLLI